MRTMIGFPRDPQKRVIGEGELARQLATSERLCSVALAIVMALLMLPIIYSWFRERADGHNVRHLLWNSFVFAGGIGYQIHAYFSLKSSAKKNQKRPKWRQFLNAFVEISLPTLLILNISMVTAPEEALISPATYVYFLLIILTALRLNPLLCIFAGSVAALEYAGLTAWHWDTIQSNRSADPEFGILSFGNRALTFFVGGLTAAFLAMQIRKRLFETLRIVEERREVVDMFGKHVSPEVVEKLLTQGVGDTAETHDVCVMVLDIRGFTTLSEHLAPDEIVSHLNKLWTLCVSIVNQHHGIVNKFLGDGFMAVFGAPLSVSEYRENAVAAAQEIVEEIQKQVATGALPPTSVGIGLHAGPVLAGSIGSEERKEYTVIGDVVNVAFRIEELNKRFDSVILASEKVRPFIGEAEAIKLESIQVKGRGQPVHVFKLA